MALKIVNLLFFGFMVFMNYLANALPINGKTTGQLSAQYPNLFVPAGITFSIWGIIYLLLLLWVIVPFFQQGRDVMQRIGWLFALSCLLNALWIVAWHYEQLPLSLVIMLGLLITLVLLMQKMLPTAGILDKAAFGIYLGWICIATIANVTALLVNYNWGGWGLSHQTWAILLISVGLGITLFTMLRFNNPFIGLVVIWAFGGIALARFGNNSPIVGTAFVAMGVMLVFTILVFAGYTHNRAPSSDLSGR